MAEVRSSGSGVETVAKVKSGGKSSGSGKSRDSGSSIRN